MCQEFLRQNNIKWPILILKNTQQATPKSQF